jgi:hypothetical protein
LQIGVPPEHVELSTHWTHAPLAVSHAGVAPPSAHCALLTQPGPHVLALMPMSRQNGPAADVVQSALDRQPTHAWFAVSQ